MNSSMEFPVVVAHHIMRTRPRSTELDANRDKAEKPIKMHSWTSWIAIGLVGASEEKLLAICRNICQSHDLNSEA